MCPNIHLNRFVMLTKKAKTIFDLIAKYSTSMLCRPLSSSYFFFFTFQLFFIPKYQNKLVSNGARKNFSLLVHSCHPVFLSSFKFTFVHIYS